MKQQSGKGASQTEYIIILVLIGLSSLMVVGNLGVKVKTLFKKSKAELSFENNEEIGNVTDSGDNNSDNLNSDNDNSSVNEENLNDETNPTMSDECQKQYNTLIAQKEKNKAIHDARLNNLNNRFKYFKSLALRYYQSYAFGFISFFGHSHHVHRGRNYLLAQRYNYLANYYKSLADAEQQKWNDYLNSWNQQMSDWERNCKH
jgi:Flp pilus assembly pilin Flp